MHELSSANILLLSLRSVISLTLVACSIFLAPAHAQIPENPKQHSENKKSRRTGIEPNETSKPENKLEESLISAFPAPPDNVWAPGQPRSEGSSRGNCQIDKEVSPTQINSLTALAPVYGSGDYEKVLGKTSVSYPTFWFYIPYSSVTSGELVLQTENRQTIYRKNISLPGTAGVVGVPSPLPTLPLKIGSRYRWYFKIYCEAEQPPVFVDGWIQREPLSVSIKRQLQEATPQRRVALLAALGLWYDALAASAELHRTDPKDPTWAALMGAVHLKEIGAQPIQKLDPDSQMLGRNSEPIAY